MWPDEAEVTLLGLNKTLHCTLWWQYHDLGLLCCSEYSVVQAKLHENIDVSSSTESGSCSEIPETQKEKS